MDGIKAYALENPLVAAFSLSEAQEEEEAS